MIDNMVTQSNYLLPLLLEELPPDEPEEGVLLPELKPPELPELGVLLLAGAENEPPEEAGDEVLRAGVLMVPERVVEGATVRLVPVVVPVLLRVYVLVDLYVFVVLLVVLLGRVYVELAGVVALLVTFCWVPDDGRVAL